MVLGTAGPGLVLKLLLPLRAFGRSRAHRLSVPLATPLQGTIVGDDDVTEYIPYAGLYVTAAPGGKDVFMVGKLRQVKALGGRRTANKW